MKVEQWEKRSEIPMLLMAAAFMVAYAWPVLDPRMTPDTHTILNFLSYAIWVVFIIDFLIRISLAPDHLHYLRSHWYDVAFVVLPFLRALRLVRLLVLLRLLGRAAATSLASQVLAYAAGGAMIAIGLGAVGVLDAERHAPGANITDFGVAIWWAVTTVTTVGYGDYYPVTTFGRVIAAALMFLGIGLVGSATGAVASWLVTKSPAQSEEKSKDSHLR